MLMPAVGTRPVSPRRLLGHPREIETIGTQTSPLPATIHDEDGQCTEVLLPAQSPLVVKDSSCIAGRPR